MSEKAIKKGSVVRGKLPTIGCRRCAVARLRSTGAQG
jgi:hypothetical protein